MSNKRLKVYVHGDFANGLTRRCFLGHPSKRFEITFDLQEADILCLTGGEDIHPGLYGEKPIPGTYFNKDRDTSDVLAITKAQKRNLFLIGICRGAQLLNVIPNHGKLWQDVDMHNGGCHEIIDNITGEVRVTNSLHHQLMRSGPDAVMVASISRATVKHRDGGLWHYIDDPDSPDAVENLDAEVLWYPKTKSLLFQAHPEFGHGPTTEYFYNLLDRYVLNSDAALAAA